MDRLNILSCILLLFLLVSCGNNQERNCDQDLDCALTSDIKVISEAEKNQLLEYYELYCFQDKMYTVYYCPLCFVPLLPMALDCNENQLCEFNEDCMDSFFEEAEYQFTFIQD